MISFVFDTLWKTGVFVFVCILHIETVF